MVAVGGERVSRHSRVIHLEGKCRLVSREGRAQCVESSPALRGPG